MSCIAAIKHGTKLYMGGDSYISIGNDYSLLPIDHPKVFIKPITPNHTMIMGGTGEYRYIQLIRYFADFQNFTFSESSDPMEYLLGDVVPEMRKVLKQYGTLTIQNSVETMSGYFLVGLLQKFYLIYWDFSVIPLSTDYAASGSGESVAKGVLASYTGDDPVHAVECALGAAAQVVHSVHSPFVVLSI
jgi:ATP-dependent protease HslVU (ClpYQ) peptidase subunit